MTSPGKRSSRSRRVLHLLLGAASCAVSCVGPEPARETPPDFPCTPAPPSPADEFAQQRDPSSASIALAEELAQAFMAQNEAAEQRWDWGESTLMLSLVDLYRVTGETSYRDYCKAWIDSHIASGYQHLITTSDRCPPALTALALYQESCEPAYRTVVTDVLHYLYEDALRTADGGINHLGINDLLGISLWLDSLFMFGNVLTRWGEHAGDEQALGEFADQYRIFAAHLQHENGLFKHAYGWLLPQDDDVYWARGNGWVTAATYEYLRVRQQRDEPDDEVAASIAQQAAAVSDTQDPATGLWWTVMNRPGEIYLETSATALFVLGLARGYRLGLLDASVLPVIERGLEGIGSRIDTAGERPVVTGISGPTTAGSFDDYAAVELGDDIHYGVGAVILALIETSGLLPEASDTR